MAWTQQKRPGRWTGYYRDSQGKARSAGTYDNKDRALTAALNQEAITRSNPHRARDLTWADWKPTWLAALDVEESTRTAYRHKIDLYIEPRWGNVPLTEITAPDIEQWINALPGSSNTHNVTLLCLSSSLTQAERRGLIHNNPVRHVKFKPRTEIGERFLTADEQTAIREKLPTEHHFAYDMLSATGIRWGELAGLHWDHVDFENGVLSVVMQWVEREQTFRPTKGKSVRRVPLPELAVDALKSRLGAIGWGEPCEAVYDRVSAQYRAVLLDGDVPMKIRRFRDALQRAAKQATITIADTERHIGKVRIHDLRHTYASTLVQNGVDIQTVSALLGHSSVAVTARYAKVSDSRWQDVRNVLSSNHQRKETP